MKKHRKKLRKLRGKRTHGRGYSKKGRGKGSRMTHRRTFGTNIAHVLKYEPWRIMIKGFIPLKKKMKGINLRDIQKIAGKEIEIDITKKGYGKVLGGGELEKPLKIKAYAFSESAKKKIEKAGGEAIEV